MGRFIMVTCPANLAPRNHETGCRRPRCSTMTGKDRGLEAAVVKHLDFYLLFLTLTCVPGTTVVLTGPFLKDTIGVKMIQVFRKEGTIRMAPPCFLLRYLFHLYRAGLIFRGAGDRVPVL